MSTMSPSLPWCADEKPRLVYTGPIREAQFGSRMKEEFQVWEIESARLGFLHPFPRVEYSDDSYRAAVNGSSAIEDYFRLHAGQQPGYLALFERLLRPGLVVADCGCGGGALLDLVKARTQARTIAIEPFTGYHASLRERGHEVYPTTEAALAAGVAGIDLALSFHVIEHVDDPVAYLHAMRRLVGPAGRAVVLTPNWDDILMRLDPARMAPFFYRRVHNYYFTAQALRWVGQRAGWSKADDIFYHEFGLANTLLWLRDGRPSGHTRLPEVDAAADTAWRAKLESSGFANNVGVLLHA